MDVIQLIQVHAGFAMLVAGIFGAMVGSFLNVVIHRLPIMLAQQWQAECQILTEQAPPTLPPATYNLVTPRSACTQCKALISAWHNIPILSYLLLRGQCAKCSAPIAWRYPVMEALTMLLSVFIVWQYNATLHACALLIFTWLLLSLIAIDSEHQLLPDVITLPLLWIGLLINLHGEFALLSDAVIGAIAGYLSLWSIMWLYKLATGKQGMGHGDFKLFAALGAWCGWQLLPLILLLSSVIGAIAGSIFLYASSKGRETPIPFGPFLAGAGWVALLWGDKIVSAYCQFAGLHG